MLSVIWASTLLSVDSFVVSLGLGPLVQGRKRYAIASAFGLCDGAAILLAPLLAPSFVRAMSPLADRALPGAVMAYAIYVMILTRNARALTRGWAGWFVLPIAASIDNLAAGPLVSKTVSVGVVAFVAALISAAMSLAALALSETLQKSVRVDPGRLAAAGFILAAAFLIR